MEPALFLSGQKAKRKPALIQLANTGESMAHIDKKVPNSKREYLINEYIHNKIYRDIMKRHFIDGESYDSISKDKSIDRTAKQIYNIIEKCCAELSDFLP